MKNYTILLFSGDLCKICWTKLHLLQDIRKCYGELFDVHVFLTSKRNCQSVAFNPLATYSLYRSKLNVKPTFVDGLIDKACSFFFYRFRGANKGLANTPSARDSVAFNDDSGITNGAYVNKGAVKLEDEDEA